MARELNSLFMPNPPMESQHRHPLFSSHDFPPISGIERFGNNTHFNSDRGVNHYQSHYTPQLNQPSFMGTQPIQSLLDTQKSITGVGEITWLSSKAGLITCTNGNVISFQLKDFCDQGVNDLLSYLRVGFSLKFSAIHHEKEEYTATAVSPVHGEYAAVAFQDAKEIDLEAAHPTPANAKEAYSPTLELSAYHAILGTFQRHGAHKVQLSSLHSQMSNYGDDKLYRYVGTSSMKRRQFVERRTHLFCLQNDDSIILQYPAVYQGVVLLSSYLLRRGGVTSIQCLYDYFMSADVHHSIRHHIGIDRTVFLNLLTFHSWAFSLFPNRQYVSARRNLPSYDYCTFIEDNFPLLNMTHQQLRYAQQQEQQPRGLQRMSASLGEDRNLLGRSVYEKFMQRQPQPFLNQATGTSTNGNHIMSLAGSNLPGSQSEDRWNPVSNLGTWSSGLNTNSQSQQQHGNKFSVEASFGNELFQGSAVNSGLGNRLIQDGLKMSKAVQADETKIGLPNCTCQCRCGRGGVGLGAGVGLGLGLGLGAGVGTNTRSNAGTIGSSRGLPTINPGINNLGPIGFNGNRPLSISTVSSDDQPQASDSYDLFGTMDVLSGGFESLRFGNY